MRATSCRAFSISELLVSIVILAVLVALAFPLLGKAREVSDNTRCVANLRFIGQQSLIFFQERRGNLFPVWDWFVHEPFIELLGFDIPEPKYSRANYVNTPFTCPAFKRAYPEIFPSLSNRCYSINYWAHQYRPTAQQAGEEVIPEIQPGNLQRIKSPSKMWMMMDGSHTDIVFTYYNHGHIPYMGRPHRGGEANAVFFDGRVAPVTPEDLAQYWQSDFWGGITD